MRTIKIIGAGSIGNHLANACRHMGWEVDMYDIDPDALKRTKNVIYPERYGKWDPNINFISKKKINHKIYDIIFIGTPPDTHLKIALQELELSPKVLCIEKPLCEPNLIKLQEFVKKKKKFNAKILVGYDHSVGKSATFLKKKLKNIDLKTIQYIDVEIREHWQGIFNAHPWLDGPHDSYLGFWKRGGGAISEHSHGINIFQFFSSILEGGRICEVNANIQYINNKNVNYDSICFIQVKTEKGLIGRITQDVVTKPSSKIAKIQTSDQTFEWHCNFDKQCDAVIEKQESKKNIKKFPKVRADDFIQEICHIDKILKNNIEDSPLELHNSIETMLVISAAHKSAKEKKTVYINYKNDTKFTTWLKT
jgi:predicted dehydrogenase